MPKRKRQQQAARAPTKSEPELAPVPGFLNPSEPVRGTDDKTGVLEVPLRIRDDLQLPAFANVVSLNRLAGEGVGDQIILSFFHVYVGPPDEPTKAPGPIGDCVSRITLSGQTAQSLRELLTRALSDKRDDRA